MMRPVVTPPSPRSTRPAARPGRIHLCHAPVIRLLLAAAAVAAGAFGCQKHDGRLEILSLRNPSAPETIAETFPDGRFRMNSGRTYEIALELEPRLLEVPAVAPADSDGPPAPGLPPDLVWTAQLVHIQILWQPLPGKTYVERTQTNAAIVYCLVNGENAISYEGAGFVSFNLSRDGRRMEGRIESASLKPTRFGKAPVDLFGPCRLSGAFEAAEGPREVASVRQRIRRLLGPPTEGFEGPPS